MIGWAIAGGATAAGALNVWIFAKAWLKDRRTRRRVFEYLDIARRIGYFEFGGAYWAMDWDQVARYMHPVAGGIDLPSLERDVHLWMTEKGLL